MEGKIIITAEDLFIGGHGFDIGLYERVDKRIDFSNALRAERRLPRLFEKEERNLLIGEVGELAVRKDLLARGHTILRDSWDDFTMSKGIENAVDILAAKGDCLQSYQIKASEVGNRTISFYNLEKYIQKKVNMMCFVAVRAIKKNGENTTFEAVITSSMMPNQIPRLATWHRTHSRFSHVDNKKFINQWESETRKLNAN